MTEVILSSLEPDPSFAKIQAPLKMVEQKTMRTSTSTFSPESHIGFNKFPKTYSMSDIELPDSPLSSFAVSEPFQLFTVEAIQRMRAEIFKPEVMENFSYSSNLAQCQLRGYAAK